MSHLPECFHESIRPPTLNLPGACTVDSKYFSSTWPVGDEAIWRGFVSSGGLSCKRPDPEGLLPRIADLGTREMLESEARQEPPRELIPSVLGADSTRNTANIIAGSCG